MRKSQKHIIQCVISQLVHLVQIVNINGPITINKTKAGMDFNIQTILSENNIRVGGSKDLHVYTCTCSHVTIVICHMCNRQTRPLSTPLQEMFLVEAVSGPAELSLAMLTHGTCTVHVFHRTTCTLLVEIIAA